MGEIAAVEKWCGKLTWKFCSTAMPSAFSEAGASGLTRSGTHAVSGGSFGGGWITYRFGAAALIGVAVMIVAKRRQRASSSVYRTQVAMQEEIELQTVLAQSVEEQQQQEQREQQQLQVGGG